MKIYIIAGEASGDLHASNLMRALLKKNDQLQFRYWGGDHMASVQGEPVKHIKDLAFMGFIEVVANLRTILRNMKACKDDILKFKPDALVLVDYPGFNLRIAKFAKEQGIKVHYYISPQIWAWKQNRGWKIKKYVDEMYCILPFEKSFYKRFDMDVHYVGHPLLDAIHNYQKNAISSSDFKLNNKLDDRPIIALLPGSRKQEIKIKLPIMLDAISKYGKQYQFIVAGAPNLGESFYQEVAKNHKMSWISNQTYDLLNQAHFALVTSGTATLETALFKVPQVVCYKGSQISYQIAKRLIKINYISLVNLIMDREVVKELIQDELTTNNIQKEVDRLIQEGPHRKEMIGAYTNLHEKLGQGGASDKVASLLLKNLHD